MKQRKGFMTSTSLNISGKIDPTTLEVLAAVNQAIAELAIPYIVVGATARDLVLHYGYGAAIQRATRDIDFAIEIPNWNAFNALKSSLTKTGFRETRAAHRLISLFNGTA